MQKIVIKLLVKKLDKYDKDKRYCKVEKTIVIIQGNIEELLITYVI